MQFVLSTTGEPASGLYDDCPICRELLAAGEPVFTFDALGQLTLLPSSPVADDDVS
jgi:hypothetical protein